MNIKRTYLSLLFILTQYDPIFSEFDCIPGNCSSDQLPGEHCYSEGIR